jgi:competence protein ComEC
MSKSQTFLFSCLAFTAGIFLSSFCAIPQLLTLSFTLLGILLVSVLWSHKRLVAVGLCFLFLAAGIWRHQQAVSQIHHPEEKEVSFSGKIVREPDVRENSARLTIEAEGIIGKVLLVTDRYPEYRYGDELEITGKVQLPREFEDFNYRDYLAKDGVYSVIYYPQIELLKSGGYGSLSSVVYAGILSLKNKLRESIYQNLSPPQGSVLAAMILGDKRQISDEWKDKLNYAGLRHLTAISGMHVAILSVILMSFLLGLGFWRKDAFYVSMILIFLFIAMTGFQPSAVRAGIMGGFFLFSQYVGRQNQSLRAVVFAAGLMLVHNPLLLRLDVGFQLSFMAMLGIIYFLPVFQFYLRRIPDFFNLKNVLTMTLSAQVFTLPILIHNFGYFSLVSPVTNILVVPLLPFIMGIGLVFALLGAVSSHLGWFISLPLWLFLTYLMKVTEWFSSFSFSALVFEISWAWLLPFYSVSAAFIWRFKEKEKLKFLEY